MPSFSLAITNVWNVKILCNLQINIGTYVDSSTYHIPESPKPTDRLVTMYHDLVAIKDYYQFNTKRSVTGDPQQPEEIEQAK